MVKAREKTVMVSLLLVRTSAGCSQWSSSARIASGVPPDLGYRREPGFKPGVQPIDYKNSITGAWLGLFAKRLRARHSR